MENQFSHLHYDPVKPLLQSNDPAIRYFTERDLLGNDVGSLEILWDGIPAIKKILKKQLPNGSFNPGKNNSGAGQNRSLTETWRQLRFLIDQYEMGRSHPAIQNACEYIFSCQSQEGDIRGILANQYAPYYTGAILYLLIKAGYHDDKRVLKGLQWLLNMRQDDGGWLIGSPSLASRTWKEVCELTSTWTPLPERDFDKSLPFSAAGTGMVIRAFAAHPLYRKSKEAKVAAALLKSKILKKDNWSSYKHPDNWVRFQFPYWWNHLVSTLDMLSLIGIPKEDPEIKSALQWFVDHQETSGLWKVSYSKIHKLSEKENSSDTRLWITLSICRIFKRYFG